MFFDFSANFFKINVWFKVLAKCVTTICYEYLTQFFNTPYSKSASETPSLTFISVTVKSSF